MLSFMVMDASQGLQRKKEKAMKNLMALANVVALVFTMALDLPIPLPFP
ncbi:MAG TPA: hypothetical protein VLG10_16715 [Methylomirabilota bacterium]|nr:hypothetical protein [Methylomirabilota bacterium]